MEELFNLPTAPYRENWVLDYVKRELGRLHVPFFTDKWGNIIAGTSHSKSLKESRRIGLLAHTDHPGFHLKKKKNRETWLARWYGGCPPDIHGAAVAIHNPSKPGTTVKGRVVSKKMSGPSKKEFLIKVDKSRNNGTAGELDKSCFGAFDFAGFNRRTHRVYTRAADDLTGVAIILCTLARLSPAQRNHMLGIFTRAEEVGFRGTLGIIYEKLIGPGNKIISLEASSQRPGARVGKGPVIRLGDRRTLFDSVVTSRLDRASAQLQKKHRKFRVQRRIMDGGTCEATPFNLHDIKAAGLAIPLGNYHNQRPSGRPGPEFIDIRDVEYAVDICVEFYRHAVKRIDPIHDFLRTLEKDFAKDIPLLKTRIDFKPGLSK